MSLLRKCDLCQATGKEGFYSISFKRYTSPIIIENTCDYDICNKCYTEIAVAINDLKDFSRKE